MDDRHREANGGTRFLAMVSPAGPFLRLALAAIAAALLLVVVALDALALVFDISFVPWAVGGFHYLKSDGAYSITYAGHDFSVLVPKTREEWIAPDGAGRIRETAGNPIFFGERDRAKWQSAGSPDLLAQVVTNRDFGRGGLGFQDTSQLPTNPDALAAVIRVRASFTSVPVNAEMFEIVRDLLRQPGVLPRLGAALYKVATRDGSKIG